MAEIKRERGVSIQHPLGEMKFPEKLPEERLQKLVQILRSGMASESDIDELVGGHIRLAISIASRFARRAPHLSDILVSEALYGVILAITKAPRKLYDDNLTPYIVMWIKRTLLRAVAQERNSAHLAQTTLARWRSRGLTIPVLKSESSTPTVKFSDLLALKEEIDACIRSSFELEVIELRKLGFSDAEISGKLQCSRAKITGAKLLVRARYESRL